jgi:hypothetical protein
MKWYSPIMAIEEPPFINSQKMVNFSNKKVWFDLEMMGFFLQYDLGFMDNSFHGAKGWKHLEK